MTKSDFQKYHDLSDDDMVRIEACLRIFKGSIVRIFSKDDDHLIYTQNNTS